MTSSWRGNRTLAEGPSSIATSSGTVSFQLRVLEGMVAQSNGKHKQYIGTKLKFKLLLYLGIYSLLLTWLIKRKPEMY